MFGRIVRVFILVLSVLVALGISALWFTAYAADQERTHQKEISRWAWDYDPSKGGMESIIRIGSFEGGIYVVRQTAVLLSKSQLPPPLPAGHRSGREEDYGEEYMESYAALGGRREWSLGEGYRAPFSHMWFRPSAITPNWKYGGFDVVPLAPQGVIGSAPGFGLVVPYWVVLAAALIAPANFIRRSAFWIAGRRVLSGRCRQCGCDRGGATGVCPQCGVGPSWAGRQLMRFGNRRWVMWWVPAVALGLFGLCVPISFSGFPTYGFGWREVLVGVAFLYMIGVAVARGFVARQPPPEAPRGFEVVIKPPSNRPDGNAKPAA